MKLFNVIFINSIFRGSCNPELMESRLIEALNKKEAVEKVKKDSIESIEIKLVNEKTFF